VDWLMFALQVLFWSPMAYRLAKRETPETSFGDELKTSHRVPGIVLYEIGLLLMWIGLGIAFWGGSMDRHVTWRGLLGAALHVAATALLGWSFLVHRSWNIQPRLEPDHQLCTTGPYAQVRHPIYLAFNLLGLGALIWAPGVLVALGALALIIGGELRAREEERVLTTAFGDEYRRYMGRVHRTIPGFY
jgi:protein-S-isoprenylcysteine O-methyltransferase Ste14